MPEAIEGRLLGGFIVKNHEGTPVLHMKEGCHHDMMLFQVLEEGEGWAALAELILTATPHMRSIPLLNVKEMHEKIKNVVVWDKRPDDDETGYVKIDLRDYWTGLMTSISVRVFADPSISEQVVP